MIRAPSYLDDNTSTFARTCPGFGKTAAQMAVAIEVYKTPMHKRALWAFCRHGWMLIPVVLAVLVFSGCTSDVDTYAAMQADLADAVAQAAKEAGKCPAYVISPVCTASTASATGQSAHCAWRWWWRGIDAMDCPTGKVQHTLATAKAASKRARQRTEKPLAPYRCAHCGFWHVGQSNGMKRRIKTVYDNHQLRFL